jgi:hypothetical protein
LLRMAILGIIAVLTSCAYASEPVHIENANLKEELGITDPTASDMLNMTYLSAEDSDIAGLTGLENAYNLRCLYLDSYCCGKR